MEAMPATATAATTAASTAVVVAVGSSATAAMAVAFGDFAQWQQQHAVVVSAWSGSDRGSSIDCGT
jgi:hypothetical protein